MLKRIMVGAVALAAGSAASAQQQQPRPVSRAEITRQLDGNFAAADANHDGSLSSAEVQNYANAQMQQAGQALRNRALAEFKRLDTNRDGQLSWPEFSAAVPTLKASDGVADVMRKLDTNHDGKISPAEFKAPRLAQFDKADLNHDGIVTPDEERRANGGK